MKFAGEPHCSNESCGTEASYICEVCENFVCTDHRAQDIRGTTQTYDICDVCAWNLGHVLQLVVDSWVRVRKLFRTK